MDNLENRIVNNINSLVMMLVSKGIKQISLPKLVLFINREYDIQMDDNNLSEILTNNKSVASVERDVITFGSEPEEENIDDSIHDSAVEQAGDNLTSESIDLQDNFKLFENVNVGDELQAKSIILSESNNEYFKHLGAKKTNATYIISEICPQKNINESYVHCKIKGESIFIDIPIKAIKKTKN